MIQKNSYIYVVDNTGILISKCIGIFPSRKKYTNSLGVVTASVQTVLSNSKFKKGMLVKILLLATGITLVYLFKVSNKTGINNLENNQTHQREKQK